MGEEREMGERDRREGERGGRAGEEREMGERERRDMERVR